MTPGPGLSKNFELRGETFFHHVLPAFFIVGNFFFIASFFSPQGIQSIVVRNFTPPEKFLRCTSNLLSDE